MALSVPIWLSAIALGITAATNVHAAFDEQALQTLLVERGRHVLDSRVTVARPHRWISVAAEVLDRYVGRYKFEDGNHLTVVRDGDLLVVQLTGQGPLPVLATGPREFFPEDIEAQFVFAESGTGPAPSLVLSQDGQSWKAERVAEERKP